MRCEIKKDSKRINRTGIAAAWVLLFVYHGFIEYLSTRPELPVDLDLGTDKIAHFAEYAVLSFLAIRAISMSFSLSIKKLTFFSMFYVLTAALADEYIQSFVAGRQSSLLDVAADVSGGVFGVILYIYLYKKAGFGFKWKR